MALQLSVTDKGKRVTYERVMGTAEVSGTEPPRGGGVMRG